MSKEDKIEVEGIIIQSLPGLVFEVQLPEDLGGGIVRGHLSGNMRKNFIKLIEGDRVTIELSPYDPGKGRITYRFSPEGDRLASPGDKNTTRGKTSKGK